MSIFTKLKTATDFSASVIKEGFALIWPEKQDDGSVSLKCKLNDGSIQDISGDVNAAIATHNQNPSAHPDKLSLSGGEMTGEIKRNGIGMANRTAAGFLSFDGGEGGSSAGGDASSCRQSACEFPGVFSASSRRRADAGKSDRLSERGSFMEKQKHFPGGIVGTNRILPAPRRNDRAVRAGDGDFREQCNGNPSDCLHQKSFLHSGLLRSGRHAGCLFQSWDIYLHYAHASKGTSRRNDFLVNHGVLK